VNGGRPTDDPEVPEADAIDQATAVDPKPPDEEPSSDPEVPEADALEQSRQVPPPD
jgi:hypothetical protein